jgi:hypothetical protein
MMMMMMRLPRMSVMMKVVIKDCDVMHLNNFLLQQLPDESF